jgi:tRNA threonylcarbamoyladenosine biosynthesis protein TsaE
MGESGAVRSPTYALIAEYAPGGRRVMHLDLYRLSDPDEILALGLADYLPGSALWLVEWPQRGVGAGLPAADAEVHLEAVGQARRVRVVPRTPAGLAWARGLDADSG